MHAVRYRELAVSVAQLTLQPQEARLPEQGKVAAANLEQGKPLVPGSERGKPQRRAPRGCPKNAPTCHSERGAESPRSVYPAQRFAGILRLRLRMTKRRCFRQSPLCCTKCYDRSSGESRWPVCFPASLKTGCRTHSENQSAFLSGAFPPSSSSSSSSLHMTADPLALLVSRYR